MLYEVITPVYNTTHDADFQVIEVPEMFFYFPGCFMQIEQGTTATRAGNKLSYNFV